MKFYVPILLVLGLSALFVRSPALAPVPAVAEGVEEQPEAEPRDLAEPAVLVAPDLLSWRHELERTEARLRSVDALEAATLTAQNGFSARPNRCSDDERLQAALRAEAFGAAWRDELQGVRAAESRLVAAAAAPTLAPILGGVDQRRLVRLSERTADHVARYLDAAALQKTGPTEQVARCGAQPLAPHPGSRASVVPPDLVPVLLLEAGRLLPLDVEVQPGVVLVRQADEGLCLTAPGNECEPDPVAPGAVLRRSS